MLDDMDNDLKNKKITRKEYDQYNNRIYISIVANDKDPKMATLCFANFLLKSLNPKLVYNEDVLLLNASNMKLDENTYIYPTKSILNPPYEDDCKPLEIIKQSIQLVNKSIGDTNDADRKVIAILPPQKFGQNKDTFYGILNIAKLEAVIKM